MKYAWLTIKHKWFVFLAGLRVGCPLWRLILHDLSKFFPSELPHYNRQFFGAADDPAGFIRCWLRHQNRNDHHWEWWIPRTRHNRCTPPFPDDALIEMSDGAILEMIADWLGAGRAYERKWPTTETGWLWWEKNKAKILPRVHPVSASKIEHIVCTGSLFITTNRAHFTEVGETLRGFAASGMEEGPIGPSCLCLPQGSVAILAAIMARWDSLRLSNYAIREGPRNAEDLAAPEGAKNGNRL
jgi:hypothetical protein